MHLYTYSLLHVKYANAIKGISLEWSRKVSFISIRFFQNKCNFISINAFRYRVSIIAMKASLYSNIYFIMNMGLTE